MKKLESLLIMIVAISPISTKAQPKLSSTNIDAVVKALTLEEKASLLVGYTGKSYFGLPSDSDPNSKDIVPGAAGITKSISRLGITNTVVSDGPAGLRINPIRSKDNNTYYCTGFPIGTSLSSSWNTDLVNSVGKAIGNEVKEYGVDVILGPGMNIMRNPLCGRNFEYYSEDPILCGRIAAAMVNGIQSNGVGISIKHFAANNQESNRLKNNSIISQRALREIYLKGFEIAVRQSKPWTVMSSYNKINGTFTQESRDLLTTILRDEWGYKGLVMTDWTALRNTVVQVQAGNDLMMPGSKEQIDDIITKVKSGELNIKDVDLCVKRMLEYIIKTPRYAGYKYSNKPDLTTHAKITRQSAVEGMVLLKNNELLLPLNDKIKNIAIFGTTSYNLIAGGTGSGDVNKAYVVDLMDGLKNVGYSTDTLLSKLYTQYIKYGKLEQDAEMGNLAGNGFFPKPRMKEPTISNDAYINTVDNNDIAIVTIGRSSGEGSDRYFEDFTLGTDETAMIEGVCKAFHQKGKKVVVILNIGGPIETASWKDEPDAILLTWQPGQEGGNSIADLLKGTAYPSGKLPVTFPVNLNDVPSTKNFPKDYNYRNDWQLKPEQIATLPNIGTTKYEEGIYVGYRYFCTNDKSVSYPFGYGLSYTTFSYSKASISKEGNNYVATVTVTNNGNKVGKEVVELYITAPKHKLDKPLYELKTFAKTRELKQGESQKLTMTFSNYDLASYEESSQSWVTDAGTYQAHFGASVADIRANVEFKTKTSKILCHNVLQIK